MRQIDLDHLAVGAWSIDEVVRRVRETVGGEPGQKFLEGSWRGVQVAFTEGIRLEVLEPIDEPADDFLPRFLERRGEGPHHVTFKVPDLVSLIDRVRAAGIEPIKVDLESENWKECFLHPSLGLGTVVQLAQPGGIWSGEPNRPSDESLVSAAFLGAEISARAETAELVFAELLSGERTELDDRVAYSWPGGGTIVVRPAEAGGTGVERVVFRILDVPAGHARPERQSPWFGGSTTLVQLGADEAWLAPVASSA